MHLAGKAGATYFALVFGAGFLFGTLRTLFLEPALGTRSAELLEMPLMLLVIVLAARFVARRFLQSASARAALGTGVFAVALVLLADIGVGVFLRRMSVAEVFLERDAVAGTAYYLMLILCAAMPWLLHRAAANRGI